MPHPMFAAPVAALLRDVFWKSLPVFTLAELAAVALRRYPSKNYLRVMRPDRFRLLSGPVTYKAVGNTGEVTAGAPTGDTPGSPLSKHHVSLFLPHACCLETIGGPAGSTLAFVPVTRAAAETHVKKD